MWKGLVGGTALITLIALGFWHKSVDERREASGSASSVIRVDREAGSSAGLPDATAHSEAESSSEGARSETAPSAPAPQLTGRKQAESATAEPAGEPHQSALANSAAEADRHAALALPKDTPIPATDRGLDARPTARGPKAELAATPEAPAEPDAPAFDLVRVSPDGQVVVAGRAGPGATVDVVIDDTVVGSAAADDAGAFVAVLETEPSAEPRQMLLRTRRIDNPAPLPADRAEETQPADEIAALPTADAGQSGSAASSADKGYALSAPVLILPTADPDAPPVVVETGPAEIEVMQPAPDTDDGLALDRVTYEAGGDVVAAGRGSDASAVRAYANDRLIAEIPVDVGGNWQAIIPSGVAESTAMLRFDEISRSGNVTSRLEAPFEYQTNGADQALRERRITVERGNNLWRIAEQHYGEGIRYSLIFGANADLIRDPDLIYPGQVFTIPELVEVK